MVLNLDEIDEFILAHAANVVRRYDPVYSHNYYEAHKKLKGRKQGSGPVVAPQQSLAPASTVKTASSIRKGQAAANAAVSNRLQSTRNTQTQDAQMIAQAASDKIVSQLNAFLKKNNTVTLAIPPNASPALRAFLTKQQHVQSASARAASQKRLAKVQKEVSKAIKHAQTQYYLASQSLQAKEKSQVAARKKSTK